MQTVDGEQVFDFVDFSLDPRNYKLHRRDTGELVKLPLKARELLLELVRGRARVLTKEDLMDSVWAGSFVEESNLSQTVFLLRKALGDNPKNPRFILTVPGRGYQFIAQVTETHADDEILGESILSNRNSDLDLNHHRPSADAKGSKLIWLAVPLVLFVALGTYWFYPKAQPASLSDIKTIAILPFDDLSAEQKDKYLGASLADALANRFSGLRQMIVRPTRSVLRYAEGSDDLVKIGRELQVDAVLDGRIQRVGERVRVRVQLVRVADNVTIWTGNFDDQFSNFFGVQDSISQQIAQSLALRIDEKERDRFTRKGTEIAEAYQEYLMGRFFWNKRTAENLDRAILHFKRAIDLDGNFALAYAGLAEAHAIYPFYAVSQDRDSLPKARVAATRALEIDGDLAEAHTVLAYVQSQYDFDWKTAESSYIRAIELNPNHANTRQWYGEYLVFQARFDESLIQMQKAIELDPTSLSAINAPALAHNASRQFDKALEVTGRILQMDANFLIAQHYRARALFFSGNHDEALELYAKVVANSNGSAFFKADYGFMLGKSGNETAARKILTELTETSRQRYVSPVHFAFVHLGLNEREKAFEYLKNAVAERDPNVILLKVGMNFDDVRNDPRFLEIEKSVNF